MILRYEREKSTLDKKLAIEKIYNLQTWGECLTLIGKRNKLGCLSKGQILNICIFTYSLLMHKLPSFTLCPNDATENFSTFEDIMVAIGKAMKIYSIRLNFEVSYKLQ